MKRMLYDDSLYIFTPEGMTSTGHVAAFDLDWALIRPISAPIFPKHAKDITLLPNRNSTLKTLVDNGYTIVIMTNQTKKNALDKIEYFLSLIFVPVIVMVATKKDKYRKPNIGMWEVLNKIAEVDTFFYCGDAAGRSQDFSDSDLKFLKNIDEKYVFYIPEKLFPPIERLSKGLLEELNEIILPTKKSMVIFVGMPGTGKTSYYNNYLKELKYVHVNQDILKTKRKVIKTAKRALEEKSNVVIDRTNPKQSDREIFYEMAKEHNYTITVMYFVGNGSSFNDLRENPVPRIAYSMYFKYLIEPTPSNTPGTLYQLVIQ
uniref:Polynucleotide kinase 3 phosphatase n=1 Tax=Pithovirus LCDPAC01 TaxID=2506600 RepID=A0A4D5XER7_9VIRU|nr:MAG: polynucleotide kinase 3 phosphatase [Pithovirus LCDPAC01]